MRTNLINARLSRKMSQQELGEMVGITGQAICKLERGHIEGRARTWDILEDILGMPQRVLRATTVTKEGA
jgi:transcriptional regulator with XRE-family HTH domain